MYDVIKKKRDGLALTEQEIHFFIDGYVKGEIPDYQAAAFLMAVYYKGMNLDETRLKDIQELKHAYGLKVLAAESEEEVEHYYSKIDELQLEEKEILNRCGVKI